jgi:glycosyltransferase involved in cell wall biosynthesis
MSSKPEKLKTAFSVTNSITHDQRVQRIAGTVSGLGCDITIIGRKVDGSSSKDDFSHFKIIRFKMVFTGGFLFYMFYNIRLFFYLLFHRYDLLVSNDLDTLLPNFLVSKIKHLPLVYDSHEYFTGVPELQTRPFVKWVWKTIEKSIFPELKYVMTVSESISRQYEKEYGVKAVVVRNCSRKTTERDRFTRGELSIMEDHLLGIIQGTGINIDRGSEELIDAVNISEKVSLLVVGSGNVLEALKEKVRVNDLSDRVKFIPAVPWPELMKYTRSADVGFSLDKDTNINYRFSLPNKIFDYFSAGIPVIAGNLPEAGRLVTTNNCGIVIPEVTVSEINKALTVLKENRGMLADLKKNAEKASESLNWETESEIVTSFYNKIIKGCFSLTME